MAKVGFSPGESPLATVTEGALLIPFAGPFLLLALLGLAGAEEAST